MRSQWAFIKKELLEQLRSSKLLVLIIVFVIFGIMSPAIAKLTPWIFEMMQDSLAESGIAVVPTTVTALDSWTQFFKNIPMALIVFVLLESRIFTKEYRSGTLLLSLTKGLSRHKVVAGKTIVLAALWTIGYWLCFGITFGYNAYFWDNGIAQHLAFAAVSWWLLGLCAVMLIVLFSTLAKSSTGVLVGTAAVMLISYLLSMIPKVSRYMPTQLAGGDALVYG